MQRLALWNLAGVFCALTLVPNLASAQKAPREIPLAQSLKGPAKEAYASAKLLLNNGDFTRAAGKYQQAYELSKDPRLLFDMAICEKNLRAYARMQQLLEQYEHEAGTSLSADQKTAVDGALEAIKDLVGRVTLKVNVPGSTVMVDGETVATDSPVVLDLGTHKLVATKPGYDTSTQALLIAGGTDRSVAIALTPEVHAGHLSVAAEPGTTIVVDGRAVARERFEGQLPAGPHEVSVTAKGKVPYKAELDLHNGETRTLDVTLVNEKSGAPIWPWVVAGVGVAAGAAVGGYFLFKPQDHTTAVPEGTLYGVQFAAWSNR